MNIGLNISSTGARNGSVMAGLFVCLLHIPQIESVYLKPVSPKVRQLHVKTKNTGPAMQTPKL